MYKNYTNKIGMPTGYIAKIWLIMRLTTVILIATLMQVSAASLAQRVTLNQQKTSLEKIFREIHKQTGYDFLYDKELLDKKEPISINVSNEPLEVVLAKCLNDQSLVYSIEDKMIVIKAEEKSFFEKIKDRLSAIDVRGRVINVDGSPLSGASVKVKSTGQTVTTNANGEFSFSKINENETLLISFIGFETKEVTAKSDLGNIVLKVSLSELDEVQVIAYGTTTRRLQTGSVSTIKSEDIEKQPVMNVLNALQGLVPGLVVNTTGGAPGAQAKIQLRGQNTIIVDNVRPFDQPLIVVDGIPYAPQNNISGSFQAFGGALAAGGANISPLNSLNPADIESISFLKDADATSIYGSQGLNGVMLITTKKGKPGKSSLNINIYTAPEKATKRIEMLNTEQYLALRREALKNDGFVSLPPTALNIANYPELLLFDSTKYTDFFQEFFGGTANNTTINSSLSGGTTETNYIASAGYTKSTYNFPGDFKNERATLHTGFSHNPVSSRLSINFGTDFSYSSNNSASQPIVGQALALPPNMPDMLNPDGSLRWQYNGFDLSRFQMKAYLEQPSNSKNLNLNSSLRLAYQILRGLKISNSLGYSYFMTDGTQASPKSTFSPTSGQTSRALFSSANYQTLNFEPQLEYQKNISKGKFSMLIGGTYKRQVNASKSITGNNYPNDALLGSPNGAGTISVTSSDLLYKYLAAFGRINYVYDNKYIINLTGRRDASSNFGPGRQFGNFGSAGVGWIFSEEKFFKNFSRIINYAKLSGNYGTVGSDGIAPYMYQDYWRASPTGGGAVVPFQGSVPYEPINLFNPDFGWGTKRMWNAALDLNLFDSRLNLNATWYQNRTGNQLTNTPLPSQTGFTTILQNLDATVQNMGWEFSLSSQNIKNKNLTWTSNFNISFNRNKLIEFKNLESSPWRTIYTIGHPVSQVPLYQLKGVNETTGIYEFYKADGKTATYTPSFGVGIGEPNDRVAWVDLQPKFNGGLSNTINFKGFELSFLLQFAKQMGKSHLNSFLDYNFVLNKANMPSAILDLKRWQKPGDKAELQKLTASLLTSTFTLSPAFIGMGYWQSSTGAYEDASYIRLKNLSLSYSLPNSWFKKAGIKNCRLYVNTQNLLTITKYKIGDPEMTGQLYVIPPQRTIAGGISLTF
ncbi:MAG: SusC/RagA family TonB-linked outer membrane protein [Bacteroidota bacterium]